MYILVLTLTQSLVFILTELGSSSKRASSHPLTILNGWHKNAMTGLALNFTNSKILNFAPVSRSSPMLYTSVTHSGNFPVSTPFVICLPCITSTLLCQWSLHLPSKLLAPEILSQTHLLGEPNLSLRLWVCGCGCVSVRYVYCILGLVYQDSFVTLGLYVDISLSYLYALALRDYHIASKSQFREIPLSQKGATLCIGWTEGGRNWRQEGMFGDHCNNPGKKKLYALFLEFLRFFL